MSEAAAECLPWLNATVFLINLLCGSATMLLLTTLPTSKEQEEEAQQSLQNQVYDYYCLQP